MLCDSCVRAHQRVRLTKDHYIVRFTEDVSKTVAGSMAGSTGTGTTTAGSGLSVAAVPPGSSRASNFTN